MVKTGPSLYGSAFDPRVKYEAVAKAKAMDKQAYIGNAYLF